MAGTIAKCKEISVGGAVVDGPLSCKFIQNDELIKKLYSNSRKPTYYRGEEVTGLTVSFTDASVGMSLKKGDTVTVIAKIDGAIKGDGTTDSATSYTATLTGGIITEEVAPETTLDGSPIEFSVTVMIQTGATFVVS